jgi:hypothetical protein
VSGGGAGSSARCYEAHGLRIACDFPLPLTAAVVDGAEADLTVTRGPDRPVQDGRPEGQLLAELDDAARHTYYVFTRTENEVVLRYPGLCEFRGDVRLQQVEVNLHPGSDSGLLAVLVSGAVLAVHIMLRGELVLHASAVEVAGAALAFVGRAGMGKSTLATLCCAEGYPLVTDDVLRTRVRPPRAMVYTGGLETRLRTAAASLAEGAPVGRVRMTADGRTSFRPTTSRLPTLTLSACVVPFPTRESTAVTVERLSPSRALQRLSQLPRIVGWADPLGLRATFEGLADLAHVVPVVEARLPWGPPFSDHLVGELLAAVTAEMM